MSHFQCPHCHSPVINDDQIAGRVVACPKCQGQLPMLGDVKPPPLITSAEVSIRAPYRASPRRHVRRKDSTFQVAVGLGIIVLIGIGVVVSLLQPNSVPSTSDATPKRPNTFSNAQETPLRKDHVDTPTLGEPTEPTIRSFESRVLDEVEVTDGELLQAPSDPKNRSFDIAPFANRMHQLVENEFQFKAESQKGYRSTFDQRETKGGLRWRCLLCGA